MYFIQWITIVRRDTTLRQKIEYYSCMCMSSLPIHRVLLDSPCMNLNMFLSASITTRPNVNLATELATEHSITKYHYVLM